MEYPQLAYVPESADPSITLETEKLVAKIIDNTGLLRPPRPADAKAFLTAGGFLPFSHHLGYHGIRTLYDKAERRNIVVPLVSWLNLQSVAFSGIENDPIDERSCFGVGRGWPMRMEKKGAGVLLTIDPLPSTQFRYTLELQPAEPDAIDFTVRFEFHRKPPTGPANFRATWPCYMSAFDDVRFFYPRKADGVSQEVQWASLGEKPAMVLGETVNYTHDQQAYFVEHQALPVGYGLIGRKALTLMFSDPNVKFFVVNAGGHFAFSSVQNPAWDFQWTIDDYPLNKPVGFEGRIIYADFAPGGADAVLRRYREWRRT